MPRSHVAEAPALHGPVADAGAIERLVGPESFGLRLVYDVEDQHAADGLCPVIVEQRAVRDYDVFVALQILEMRSAQRRLPRAAVRLIVRVNDELHRTVPARIVALAHREARLPAFHCDRLEDAGLR